MYEVVGIEHLDYVNKQGKRVQGVIVHTKYEKDSCMGICVENFYIQLANYDDNIVIGSNIEPLYNKYRQVQSLQIL